MKSAIIIPIYHPDEKFIFLLKQLEKQTIKNIPVLIIDSGSDGHYRKLLTSSRYDVIEIDSKDFNHGGTRQWGTSFFPDADIYVFLTQDAILAEENALDNIIKVFSNKRVGCAYGRQLPQSDADFFATFARAFNYGDKSYIRDFSDRKKYGVKTVFISNSFAAYRREAMLEIGGFPSHTILSEDMYAAAKMLMKGWKIAYVSDAKVYHSHNYTITQEFHRYFDIGVFHAREPWIRKNFGKAEGEGKRFVLTEIVTLIKNKPFSLPEMFIRDGMKFLGYRLGIMEKYFSTAQKKKLSMTKSFWK